VPNYEKRIEHASALMTEHGLDVLLLTKPANMFYLTGDGRLCAYLMLTRDREAALGVPGLIYRMSRSTLGLIILSGLRTSWG